MAISHARGFVQRTTGHGSEPDEMRLHMSIEIFGQIESEQILK
jgi:hypothetical protein